MRLVGTEACVREIRGVDRRGDTAKGMGAAAQYRRRTGGVSKGMGRAGSSKEKGRAEKEGNVSGIERCAVGSTSFQRV